MSADYAAQNDDPHTSGRQERPMFEYSQSHGTGASVNKMTAKNAGKKTRVILPLVVNGDAGVRLLFQGGDVRIPRFDQLKMLKTHVFQSPLIR